jgi:hypothetical protein
MTTSAKDELRKIAESDDLHISPFREDGVRYGTPTVRYTAPSMTLLTTHIGRSTRAAPISTR